MAALNDLLEFSSPAVLFHYTSFAAFESIIRTRKLWATNIRYLNDSAEIDHALNLAIEHVTRRFGGSVILKPISVFFEQALKEPEYLQGLLRKRLSVCVTSFSENGDALSQWRGYCPKGLGISIGFDPTLFQNMIAAQNNSNERFGRCIYDELSKRELIEEVLRLTCEFEYDEKKPGLETWAQIFADDVVKLLNIAPLLKHPAFAEEREWRYILSISDRGYEKTLSAWKFRTDSSTLVPYLEFDLTEEMPLILKEIILSPTPHPERAVDAVELCLAANQVKCENVRVSTIPFRNW